MKELTTAKCLDLILENCIKKDDKPLSVHEIKNNIFPELTEDEITLLLTKISNSSDPIAKVTISDYTECIEKNGITERFLKQGGFSEIEKEEVENQKKQEYKEKLELEKTEIDLDLAKRMLKEYPKTKWFARFGFFIAVGLAFFEIIKFIFELIEKNSVH